MFGFGLGGPMQCDEGRWRWTWRGKRDPAWLKEEKYKSVAQDPLNGLTV